MRDYLVTFLRARLDEDEAEVALGWDFASLDSSGWLGHAAMWGRDRAMAEVESKRRILALVEIWHEPQHKGPNRGHVRSDTYAVAARQELYVVLVQLALPYADHPDYQEAWRP